jgi:hypothetical protein
MTQCFSYACCSHVFVAVGVKLLAGGEQLPERTQQPQIHGVNLFEKGGCL